MLGYQGDVQTDRMSPGFLVKWCFEKLLDGWKAEFINKIFPGSSDSFRIRVCDPHFEITRQVAC